MNLNDLYNVELWRRASNDLRLSKQSTNQRERLAMALHNKNMLSDQLQHIEDSVAIKLRNLERFNNNIARNSKAASDANATAKEISNNSLIPALLLAYEKYLESGVELMEMQKNVAGLKAMIEAADRLSS